MFIKVNDISLIGLLQVLILQNTSDFVFICTNDTRRLSRQKSQSLEKCKEPMAERERERERLIEIRKTIN